jgi:hypothetical protein
MLVNNDPAKAPVKTVESYWPYATTLCAYILAQAKIVPESTTLDARSLAAVRMPNRDGFVADPRPEKFPPPRKD